MAYTEQYEVDFSVSITPKIKQLQSGDTQSSSDLYYMDDEIGKSLGGSGRSGGLADGDGTTLTASGDDVTGWASGAPAYVTSNATRISGASHGMGIIKNTGHEFSSSSALGDALTKTSGKWTTAESITLTFGGSTAVVCTLYPGEAMILPRWSAGACVTATASGSTHMAIEYALIK